MAFPMLTNVLFNDTNESFQKKIGAHQQDGRGQPQISIPLQFGTKAMREQLIRKEGDSEIHWDTKLDSQKLKGTWNF